MTLNDEVRTVKGKRQEDGGIDLSRINVLNPEEKQGGTLHNLSKLEEMYDFDGRGKTTGQLSQLGKILMSYDKNGDGKFSKEEVVQILEDLAKQEKKTRTWTKISIILLFTVLFACAAMVGAVFIGNEATKENHTRHHSLLDKNGNIVSTSLAETKLKLFVAPILPLDRLADVQRLELKYIDSEADSASVHAVFKVANARLFSKTRVQFDFLSGFGYLKIWDGTSTYVDGSNKEHIVCESDLVCAAFTINEATDVAKLEDEANEALRLSGHAEKRRRHLSNCGYNYDERDGKCYCKYDDGRYYLGNGSSSYKVYQYDRHCKAGDSCQNKKPDGKCRKKNGRFQYRKKPSHDWEYCPDETSECKDKYGCLCGPGYKQENPNNPFTPYHSQPNCVVCPNGKYTPLPGMGTCIAKGMIYNKWVHGYRQVCECAERGNEDTKWARCMCGKNEDNDGCCGLDPEWCGGGNCMFCTKPGGSLNPDSNLGNPCGLTD